MNPRKKDNANQQVQVFVRVRPLNKQEAGKNAISIRANKEVCVYYHNFEKKYTFDKVFGPESKQVELYKSIIQQTILEVISGYNCTVLAYGQTGSGKTYTMAGGCIHNLDTTAWFEDEHAGIIPRSLSHIFDELRVHQLEHTVRVSYLELYNEEIFDLLSPVEDNTKLKLFDDHLKKGSVIVQGLQEILVHSKNDVYRILTKGAEKRRTAATLMNAQSSRSHTVFCITVHTKENSIDGEDLLKTGKLYLVDLAGSENIKQSGATDIRAREAASINQSLLTLGRCICKLNERSGHIPYRESKLTRLLQDSLGGRTKTTLIATVSPASFNTDESINTLEYAMRAKNIVNRPEINQRLSKKTLIKEYIEEIERLRKDLAASRSESGFFMDEENYEALMRERSCQKEEIAEKIGMIRMLQSQMETKEQLFEELKISLENHQKEVEEKVSTISSLEMKLDEVSEEITKVKEENQISQFITQKYSETAQQLKSTASELLSVTDVSTVDAQKLHKKIDVLVDLEKHNRQLCEQQASVVTSSVNIIGDKLDVLSNHNYNSTKSLLNMATSLQQDAQVYLERWEEVMGSLTSVCTSVDRGHSQIEEMKTSTTGDIDMCKDNIMHNVAIAKRDFENQFNKSLIPKIHNLLDCSAEREKLMAQYIEQSKVMIENNHKEVTEFINICKGFVDQAKREQTIQAKHENEKYERINEYIANEEKSKILIQSTIENMLKEYVESSEKRTSQWKEDLRSMQNNITDHLDNNMIQSDKTINYMDQFTTLMQETNLNDIAIIQSTELKKTEMNDNVKMCENTVAHALKHCEDVYKVGYQNIDHFCSKEMSKLSNSLVDTLSEHQTSIVGLSEIAGEAKETMNSGLAGLSQMCNDLENIKGGLEDHGAIVSNMKSEVSTAVDKWFEEQRKMLQSLKVYKVSGETPQRKQYRYPRVLPDTVTHDQLVEEFQKVRSSSASSIAVKLDEGKENELEKTHSASETNIPTLIRTISLTNLVLQDNTAHSEENN